MIVLPVTIFIRKQVIFMTINDLKDKVISGGLITIDDALFLSEADLNDLCKAADEIQHTFFGNDFDICAVVNVKGGKLRLLFTVNMCKDSRQSPCNDFSGASFKTRKTP